MGEVASFDPNRDLPILATGTLARTAAAATSPGVISALAWIVLRPEFMPDDGLAREIQGFVKSKLAAHEYPRLIAFVDSLPMTATGKIIHRALRTRGYSDSLPR